MSDRYIVTETVGWLTPSHGNPYRHPPGRSYHVIDTLHAHRIIAIYRTEDVKGREVANRFALQRERADATAARMNARHLETIRQAVRP